MRSGLALCILLLVTGTAEARGPADAAGWTFDPWITLPLLAAAALYGAGSVRLWQRTRLVRAGRAWRSLSYAAGWLVLAAALVSPLHALGEQVFTAHMIEHEVVMTIAAPLLVLARPGGTFLWAFPPGMRHRLGRLVRAGAVRRGWNAVIRPLTATLLHGVAIWIWHVPRFFDAAVTITLAHRLQHLSFLITAVLFWWAMVWRAAPAVAAADVFITMIHTALLGALMTFAPIVLYGVQTTHSGRWGLTPLEDQQLAGLVMWIPIGTIYAAAAVAFFARWVTGSGRSWKVDDALAP
jgi:cytochrome c oxidase assembly factor CtaG